MRQARSTVNLTDPIVVQSGAEVGVMVDAIELDYEPLVAHGRMRTTDPEHAQSVVSAVYEPHVLDIGPRARLDAKLNAVETGKLTLGYLYYGPRAHITLPPSEHWYHVNITLTGESVVGRAGERTSHTRGLHSGCVLVPDRAQTIEWAPGTGQFAIRAAREDLETMVAGVRGTTYGGDIPLTFSLDSPGGARLMRSVRFVQQEWDEAGMLGAHASVRRHMDSLLLSSLALAVTEGEEHVGPPAGSLTVRHALEWLDAHIEELPTIADVARVTGVSARTVQARFLAELACTPTQYIRRLRLAHARDQLLYPLSTEETVTDVAIRWGFYHLGRFAALYRENYGEHPSDSLRRGRGE